MSDEVGIGEKYTVIIADSDKKALSQMKADLEKTDRFVVSAFAFDGRQAAALVMQHRPDLLIADLIMPQLDCYAMLEELGRRGYDAPTKIVMTSAVSLDYVMKRAEAHGIGYIFLKPFDSEVFLQRVLSLMAHDDTTTANGRGQSAAEVVTRHIKMVGIPANVKGYQYLRDAILMVCEDYSLINRLTRGVYLDIAKKHDSTPQRVERAMRHAIGAAFMRADADVLRSYFGHTVTKNKRKPTNGEFIAMLADRLSAEFNRTK